MKMVSSKEIKLKRMKWQRYVASTEIKNVYKILIGKPERKNHWGKLEQKCIFNKSDAMQQWHLFTL